MTLDQAIDTFADAPTEANLVSLVVVSREYANDEMISESEARALIAEARRQSAEAFHASVRVHSFGWQS